MIRLRDEGGYKTRFVVRFVRQPINEHEWPAYKDYWMGVISLDKRDVLICYDMHNWSAQVTSSSEYSDTSEDWRDPIIDTAPCHHIFEKLVILADGSVALCFEDILTAQFGFGNAFDSDPVDIFNSARFAKIRKLHNGGKRCNMNICSQCMVLYNEPKRILIQGPQNA